MHIIVRPLPNFIITACIAMHYSRPFIWYPIRPHSEKDIFYLNFSCVDPDPPRTHTKWSQFSECVGFKVSTFLLNFLSINRTVSEGNWFYLIIKDFHVYQPSSSKRRDRRQVKVSQNELSFKICICNERNLERLVSPLVPIYYHFFYSNSS